MKKNRIISGVLAAALAIVPFTGTGIDSIDKELTKETAITANAAYEDFTPGLYYVNRDFTDHDSKVFFKAGTYINVDANCMCRGAKMLWHMKPHWNSDLRTHVIDISFVRC